MDKAKVQQLKDDGFKILTLKVIGGEMPGPTLAQKAGPLGLNGKQIGEEIKKATAEFKGIKLHVMLIVKDRKATIELIPGTGALILKALREPVRDRKKVKNVLHNGSISMEDVLQIARIKKPLSNSNSFAGTVKEILGTCTSVGCKIEGKLPKQVIEDINSGLLNLPVQ
ncbi:hypothetical protein H311_03378 [Anncaliia algerae PRA109]|nr:hypothetical protein H311_03378 [Anncaliia algerae PRA109]